MKTGDYQEALFYGNCVAIDWERNEIFTIDLPNSFLYSLSIKQMCSNSIDSKTKLKLLSLSSRNWFGVDLWHIFLITWCKSLLFTISHQHIIQYRSASFHSVQHWWQDMLWEIYELLDKTDNYIEQRYYDKKNHKHQTKQ